MKLLVRLAANALGVWLAVTLVSGLQLGGDNQWVGLAVVAVVLGLVNALVRPIAKFFSFPIVILSLGLFILVINALMLQLTVWITGDLLTSTGFGATFLGAVIVSLVSWLTTAVLTDDD